MLPDVREGDVRCSVTVPGKVQCDHRARVTSRGTFMPAAYRAYMRGVHLCALAARPRGWPLDARYGVHVTLHEPDARSRDLDNAAKGALDGCKGALWGDDRQIDRLTVERGAVDRTSPRVVVEVSLLAASCAAPGATEGGSRVRAPGGAARPQGR